MCNHHGNQPQVNYDLMDKLLTVINYDLINESIYAVSDDDKLHIIKINKEHSQKMHNQNQGKSPLNFASYKIDEKMEKNIPLHHKIIVTDIIKNEEIEGVKHIEAKRLLRVVPENESEKTFVGLFSQPFIASPNEKKFKVKRH